MGGKKPSKVAQRECCDPTGGHGGPERVPYSPCAGHRWPASQGACAPTRCSSLPGVVEKPAALRSGPARHVGWFLAVLQSSFTCFIFQWVRFFPASQPSRCPSGSSLLPAQLRYRSQVSGEGREQPGNGSICSLVFWQLTRCRVDSGWLPAHTSCNIICAVTKSQIILSQEAPCPEHLRGAPRFLLAWPSPPCEPVVSKPVNIFTACSPPCAAVLKSLSQTISLIPFVIPINVRPGYLQSVHGGGIFFLAKTISGHWVIPTR